MKTYYIIKRGTGEDYRYLRPTGMYGKTLSEAVRFDNIRDAYRAFAKLSTAQPYYEGNTGEIIRVEETPGASKVVLDPNGDKFVAQFFTTSYISDVASPTKGMALTIEGAALFPSQGAAIEAVAKRAACTGTSPYDWAGWTLHSAKVTTSAPIVKETVVA